MSGFQALPYEDGVVWLEDVSGFRYVRSVVTYAGTRRRPISRRQCGQGRIVGYTTLTPDARRPDHVSGFERHYFYVKPYDPSETPDGPYQRGALPAEGVDPRTIPLMVVKR